MTRAILTRCLARGTIWVTCSWRSIRCFRARCISWWRTCHSSLVSGGSASPRHTRFPTFCPRRRMRCRTSLQHKTRIYIYIFFFVFSVAPVFRLKFAVTRMQLHVAIAAATRGGPNVEIIRARSSLSYTWRPLWPDPHRSVSGKPPHAREA